MRIFACLILIAFCNIAAAADLIGKVVKVADGDTITVLSADNQKHRIRLAQIDAPERRQPWGAKSKDYLTNLVAGKTVKVVVTDTDRYGRKIGTVFVNGIDVCKEQVSRGNAWVYSAYATDRYLSKLENLARINKRGLWGLHEKERIAPWEWRKQKASERKK